MNARAREFAEHWNQKWFGFWAEEQQATGVPFSLDDHVDRSWRPTDHQRLVDYLKHAPVAAIAQNSSGKCAFCEQTVLDSCYRTDGEWLWIDALGHLVECHAFVLPDRFVEHIRSKGYVPPASIDVAIDRLPWPAANSISV